MEGVRNGEEKYVLRRKNVMHMTFCIVCCSGVWWVVLVVLLYWLIFPSDHSVPA
jgi:hypothetical protein